MINFRWAAVKHSVVNVTGDVLNLNLLLFPHGDDQPDMRLLCCHGDDLFNLSPPCHRSCHTLPQRSTANQCGGTGGWVTHQNEKQCLSVNSVSSLCSILCSTDSHLYPSFQGLMSDNHTQRLGLAYQQMIRIQQMLYIAARSLSFTHTHTHKPRVRFIPLFMNILKTAISFLNHIKYVCSCFLETMCLLWISLLQ